MPQRGRQGSKTAASAASATRSSLMARPACQARKAQAFLRDRSLQSQKGGPVPQCDRHAPTTPVNATDAAGEIGFTGLGVDSTEQSWRAARANSAHGSQAMVPCIARACESPNRPGALRFRAPARVQRGSYDSDATRESRPPAHPSTCVFCPWPTPQSNAGGLPARAGAHGAARLSRLARSATCRALPCARVWTARTPCDTQPREASRPVPCSPRRAAALPLSRVV